MKLEMEIQLTNKLDYWKKCSNLLDLILHMT